jgi:hypothetical protein
MRSRSRHRFGKFASAKAFDDYEVEGVSQSIDPLLKKIENVAGGIINMIVAARSLRGLSGKERTMVALFTTVQMAPNGREA